MTSNDNLFILKCLCYTKQCNLVGLPAAAGKVTADLEDRIIQPSLKFIDLLIVRW